MNAIIKNLSDINTFQIVFFRSISSLFFTLSFLLKNKIPVLGNNKKLLVLRSLIGVTSMSLFWLRNIYQ